VKVYIAGLYTPRGGDEEARLRNVAQAREAGVALMKAGHTPFCPHTMTDGWEAEGIAYKEFMRVGLEWVAVCDALLLLPGWRTSPGARAECALAKRIGLRICTWNKFCSTGRL
jgi:hypothetical protein